MGSSEQLVGSTESVKAGQIEGVTIVGEDVPGAERVLTADALQFLAALAREFEPRRTSLLARRRKVGAAILAGDLPAYVARTAPVREAAWRVAPAPADLLDRRVEITGPPDTKVMINALNSGARVFMADFEDALSPTWTNVVGGQANCIDAARRVLTYTSPEGRAYQLAPETATLVVRPRGWHLDEKHVLVDGTRLSASLFDFGLYFYHNAKELLARGSGPYFYLAKLESHLEARLWNDVFDFAQDALDIPRGTIRATVLIETITAAFEMDEILYELRDHSAGLNAGRWDYIFSVIKKFRNRPDFVLPDRSQVTMTVPFMRAYSDLLVKTCHRRGAHAIGGMAAFIPSRRDAEVNAIALAKVRDDKRREAGAGFDGTWVSHPDMVPVVLDVFDTVLGDRPHQKERLREDVQVTSGELRNVAVPGGQITQAGVRANVRAALHYLERWLAGIGAVGIDNLMEDAATAEISRAQLWQWVHLGATTEDGSPVTIGSIRQLLDAERAAIDAEQQGPTYAAEAAALLDRLIADDTFAEFLTLPAYELLP